MTPNELVDRSTLIVCVGSGGVGKTTLAAALGVRAARRGRRVLVLTINPARRLANSLGLSRFGNDEALIELEGAQGELWAMMLDTRTTMDSVVRRVAADEATVERIFNNNIYRNIADSFASNQEYMATEKLYDVGTSGNYDLIVLDTPPVKNALDFLDAPGRLTAFLDKKVMKWFLTPYDEGQVFGRLLMGTSAVVFRLIGYIFGREFLEDLSDFFLAFRDLYDGFRERQNAVLNMFTAEGTAFVVVGGPTELSVTVAEYFLEELGERGMRAEGVVINRLHPEAGNELDPAAHLGTMSRKLASDLPERTAERLLARLGAAHGRLRELAYREALMVERIGARLAGDQRLWTVHRLETEVNDVASLDILGDELFGE